MGADSIHFAGEQILVCFELDSPYLLWRDEVLGNGICCLVGVNRHRDLVATQTEIWLLHTSC